MNNINENNKDNNLHNKPDWIQSLTGRALIDRFTRKIMCPSCHKSKFKVINKEPENEGKISCHAKCSSCGKEFVFTKDKKGRIIL